MAVIEKTQKEEPKKEEYVKTGKFVTIIDGVHTYSNSGGFVFSKGNEFFVREGKGYKNITLDLLTKPEPKEEVKKKEKTATGEGILKLIDEYVEDDLLAVFGETGGGKSKLAVEVATKALALGKKVFFLDTEGNLNKKERKELNGNYVYEPRFDAIKQKLLNLPKGLDYVIVDSIGYPVLVKFSLMGMKQRGDALLSLIAINGALKEYCKENNCVALVTTQPESEFNKDQDHILRPFGDKSQFATKEIWRIRLTTRGKVTKSILETFRSRETGYGTKLATIEISDEGTKILIEK